jgi:predicted Rossmann fold nucleotide-binding protein DprA/Smf involved in DNA uptake
LAGESNKKETPVFNGTKLEQDIIGQLKLEPMDVDLISRNLNIAAAKIGTTISLLQLKGFINQDSGKYYIN